MQLDFTDEELREAEAAVEANRASMASTEEKIARESRRLARKIGIDLQKVMMEQDVSVVELAERLDMKPAYVRRFLLGEDWESLEELVSLAHALDCQFEITMKSAQDPG